MDKYLMPLNTSVKEKGFTKILIGYASSQLSGNILKMIAGFFTVKLIAPDIYGYFNGQGIFLGYLTLAHFGVMNGLNRELPIEQGRNNIDRVQNLADIGFFVSLVIGSISCSVLFFLAFRALING